MKKAGPFSPGEDLGCTGAVSGFFSPSASLAAVAGSWLPVKPRGYVEAQNPSSWPPAMLWEGRAGVRWGFTLFPSWQEKTRGMGTQGGSFLPLLHPRVSTLDGGDGHRRQTLLQPGLFMGKGCSRGKGEEIWGCAPSCLHNACLRSLPVSLVLSQPIPPVSLALQVDACIPPRPFSAPPELGEHLGALSTPKAAATQLTPLGPCCTEPPLKGPRFSTTSEPRSHEAPHGGSGSTGHRCTKSPPPRAQIHLGASQREAG